MAFIIASEVAEYSGLAAASITQAQIDVAESLVASFIGADTLDETSHTDYIYKGSNGTRLILQHGPVASIDSVTSVTISATAVTMSSLYMGGYWMLFYPTSEFPNGTKITVVYTSGWDSEEADPLPANLKKGLILTCASLSKLPVQGMKSEDIGDYSYTLMDGADNTIDSAIPDAAKIMLTPYLKPDYLY